MNKFKKVLLGALSVLTLGLFVVTGTKVNAAATTALATPTATNDTYASGSAYIYGNANSDFSIQNGSSTAKAVSISSTIENTTYNFGVMCNSNGKGFTFATKSAVTADIYFAVTSSSATQTTAWSFAGQSGSGKAGYHITVNFAANASETLAVSGKRICLYLVTYEATQMTTVTFMDGTTQLDQKSLAAGSTITYAPEKDGYQFDGWVDSNNNAVTTVPTTATTLYAKWIDLSAYYTVNFNSNGGSDVNAVNAYYDSNNVATLGSSMPSNPTKDNYKFAGWYTQNGLSNDEWGTRVLASTQITESMTENKEITLYAKWTAFANNVFTFDGYENFSSLPTATTENDQVITTAPITLIGGANVYSKAVSSGSQITFNDGSKRTYYYQGARVQIELEKDTLVTIYAVQTGKEKNRIMKIFDSNNELVKSYRPCDSNDSSYDAYGIYLKADTYLLDVFEADDSKEGYCNFYGITFEEFEASPSVAFNCQYDTKDPSQATKIRFIATMDGIVDPLLIDSVTFTITVGDDAQEFKCTKLYSSLSNKYSELGSGDGRVYAVYALSGIDTVIASGNVSFASLSVTVNFTAASGLSPVTANHDGFTLGSYE